ncbi:MAG: hypothetical protein ACTSSF_06075 [Candidatus Heimdallarchaeaceae archaeon]
MTVEETKVRDFGLIFYLWMLVVLAAYALGVYAIIDLANQNQGILDWIIGKIQGVEGYTIPSSLLSMKYWILGGIAGLFVVGLIIAFVEIWLMSYLGAEIVITTIFGIPLLIAGGGIYTFFVEDIPAWVGIVVLAPAVFLIVIVLLIARRIILGAKIFETSCEAVNENKRTLIPIIFYSIVSLITFAFGTATSVWVGLNLGNIPVIKDQAEWVQMLVFFLIIYVFLAIYWTAMYFFDAINICIFKRWNNYKDASIRIAMKEVWKVKGSIVLFGMFMAFFDWIIKVVQYFVGKKLKQDSKFYKVWSVLKKILYVIFFLVIILLKWLFKILKFLNYYTLTLIVVEKQGFIKSIARSSELALDSGADIIIGKTGVNIAKGLFSFLTFAIFAVGGFFVGYYWLGLEFAASNWEELGLYGLAIALVFFFFGYLPMSALFKPLNTAYKTILFYYITDPFRGHTGRRTRLSSDVQNSISKVREKVMEDYDKEERPKWDDKKQDEIPA